MRDWNTQEDAAWRLGISRLYLTYEGLKHKFIEESWDKIEESLYLTYEGLKHTAWRLQHFYISLFVSYLWGIETYQASNVIDMHQAQFVSYLWGIETDGLRNGMEDGKYVCILPMRDWNENAIKTTEFKTAVCILPMRDWNQAYRHTVQASLRFVSYLWGIETTLADRCIRSGCVVCILPMRDWNAVIFVVFFSQFSCLYLTYEGLKPLHGAIKAVIVTGVCILPMRDWNTHNPNSFRYVSKRLYLTYEGLKQREEEEFRKKKKGVCILPMRDWNDKLDKQMVFWDMFVSYLWGIETGEWWSSSGHAA